MIIYGSRATHLKTAKSKKLTCPSCGTQGSLSFSVFRRHAHIFLIPLFPIGKIGLSECEHCKNILKTKEMPENLKREYKDIKNNTKGPIWQFFGLAIIAGLIIWGIYSEAQNYPTLVKVAGGTFMMGDKHSLGEDDEQPTHEVTLDDYYIGKTEVTVAQYRTYCKATGVNMHRIAPSLGWKDSYPIVNVNRNDAIKYCKWLSKKLGKTITLPTEAQWEFAARGGNKSKGYKYSGSNTLGTVGWYDENSNSEAHKVAQKKANELGLYDMSGNVWEWCLDWYSRSYYSNSRNMRIGFDFKVYRGGSWYSDASDCRVTYRGRHSPGVRGENFGFRVVSF